TTRRPEDLGRRVYSVVALASARRTGHTRGGRMGVSICRSNKKWPRNDESKSHDEEMHRHGERQRGRSSFRETRSSQPEHRLFCNVATSASASESESERSIHRPCLAERQVELAPP